MDGWMDGWMEVRMDGWKDNGSPTKLAEQAHKEDFCPGNERALVTLRMVRTKHTPALTRSQATVSAWRSDV